jgi:hypothetical protein
MILANSDYELRYHISLLVEKESHPYPQIICVSGAAKCFKLTHNAQTDGMYTYSGYTYVLSAWHVSYILSTILMIKPTSLERRAVGSNMVLSGWFVHGIRICRFTATQIKAEYHGR